MTTEEAQLFFTLSEQQDIETIFDEKLFEYKRFFLVKSPIDKVFRAKLGKLQQEDQAYHLLSNLEWTPYIERGVDTPVFSQNVLDAFLLFEKEKGRFKMQLMQAKSGEELYQEVNAFLTIVQAYRQLWMLDEMKEEAFEGTVSKELDPMELLNEIRSFNALGGKEFQDIVKIEPNSFLLNEMKRVSLLIKKYGG